MTVPTLTVADAGVLLGGDGGTARIILGHVLDRHSADTLRERGVRFVAGDMVRVDPLCDIPPLNSAVDCGEASRELVVLPGRWRQRAERIKAGDINGAGVTPAAADQALRNAPPKHTGAGRNRQIAFMEAEEAGATLGQQYLDAAAALTPAGNRPVHCVHIVSTAGGVGAGTAVPIAGQLHRGLPAGSVLWRILVGPSQYASLYEPADVASLLSHSLSVERELELLEDVNGPSTILLHVDTANICGDLLPRDSVLSAVATFGELLIEHIDVFNGIVANIVGNDMHGASRRERHGALGAASVRPYLDVWSRLFAHETAAAVSDRMRAQTGAVEEAAVHGGKSLIHSTHPLSSAWTLVTDEPADVASILDPDVVTPQEVGALINISPSDNPPVAEDLLDVVGVGWRNAPDDVVAAAEREVEVHLSLLGGWLVRQSVGAQKVLIDGLRDYYEQRFRMTESSPTGFGANAEIDPSVVVEAAIVARTILDLCTDAADRIDRDLSAILHSEAGNPVELADDNVAHARRDLEDRPSRANTRRFLDAMNELLRLRGWEQAVIGVRETYRALAATARAASEPVEQAREFLDASVTFAEDGANEALEVLTTRAARSDTRILPRPDAAGVDAFREALSSLLGRTDVISRVLANLKVQVDTTSVDPAEWAVLLVRPSSGSSGRAVPMVPSSKRQTADLSLPMQMVQEQIDPVLDQLVLADLIAIEAEATRDQRVDADVAIEERVTDIADWLARSAVPLLEISAPQDERPDTAPVTNELVFVDTRPTTKFPLSHLAHDALVYRFPNAHAERRPMLSQVSLVVRLSDARIASRAERIPLYLGDGNPFPTMAESLHAYALERMATEVGLLRGRLLTPEVVRLLKDPEALRRLGSLLALGGLDSGIDADDITDGVPQLRIELRGRTGILTSIPVGRVDDPHGAISRALLGPDSARITDSLADTFSSCWQQLVAQHHGDEGAARAARRDAIKAMCFSDSAEQEDLRLVLLLLAIESDHAAGFIATDGTRLAKNRARDLRVEASTRPGSGPATGPGPATSERATNAADALTPVGDIPGSSSNHRASA